MSREVVLTGWAELKHGGLHSSFPDLAYAEAYKMVAVGDNNENTAVRSRMSLYPVFPVDLRPDSIIEKVEIRLHQKGGRYDSTLRPRFELRRILRAAHPERMTFLRWDDALPVAEGSWARNAGDGLRDVRSLVSAHNDHGNTTGDVIFTSRQLARDVQGMVMGSYGAHGWMLRDVTESTSFGRHYSVFDSSTADDPAVWPVMTIQYRYPEDDVETGDEGLGGGTGEPVPVGGPYMVQLGRSEDEMQSYAVKPATRHRREAPSFLERFSTGETSHRGDAFWQHWVQAGFRGGMGQEIFQDVEMVDQLLGLHGLREGRLEPYRRTPRILLPRLVDTTEATTPAPMDHRAMRFAHYVDLADVEKDQVEHLFAGEIYGESDNNKGGPARLYWTDDRGTTWSYTLVGAQGMGGPGGTAGVLGSNRPTKYQGVSALTYYQWKSDHEGYIMVGDRYGDIWYAKNPANGLVRLTHTQANHPLDAQRAITVMIPWNNRLYVSQNNKVWAWDGKGSSRSNWTQNPVVEADIHFTCATVWNGAMYWGGYQSFTGKLYRIDSTGAMEVATFPDNFSVQSVCSYDGSLYVGGATYDAARGRHVGRIYRYNGSSVRELDLGKAGVHRQANYLQGIWDMEVWEGQLLIPAADFQGVLSYNAAEDAFTRLPRLIQEPLTKPDQEMVFNMAIYGGELYASVPMHGIFKMHPTEVRLADLTLTYFMDTSIFDGGTPLVDKYWASLTVRLEDWDPLDYIDVYYRTSQDAPWVFLEEFTDQDREWWFPTDLLSRSLQLRFDFAFVNPGTPPHGAVYSGKFAGFFVRYVQEPNVRYNWAMQLLCVDNIEWPDGTMENRGGDEMSQELWSLRKLRLPVRFVDVDGQPYWCVIRQLSEYQHSINLEDGYESTVSIQLWEG